MIGDLVKVRCLPEAVYHPFCPVVAEKLPRKFFFESLRSLGLPPRPGHFVTTQVRFGLASGPKRMLTPGASLFFDALT